MGKNSSNNIHIIVPEFLEAVGHLGTVLACGHLGTVLVCGYLGMVHNVFAMHDGGDKQ